MALPRFVLAASLILACSASAARSAEPAPDFNRDVAPVLRKYCVACHGAEEPEKGLVLDSYAGILKGGERGAVLVAGASDRSRLLLVLDGRAKPAMPPDDNEKPSANEIAILKRWIDAGAKGPSGAEPDPTILITPRIKPRKAVQPAITAVAISPDGKLLALAGYQEVRLVDRQSRAVVATLTGLRGNVAAIAFSKDGKLLATAGGEPGLIGEARLWRVADGAMQRTFRGHKDSLYAVALSPDGKLLATGSYDQQIKLWDTAAGKELRTVIGHNGAIFDLAFNPSGKILASASADRTVKLWSVADGQRLDTLSQPLKDVYCVAFSPDGKTLVSGSVDSRIRIYKISDTAAENTNPLVVAGFAHEGAVLKLAFLADGKTLATSGEDRAVRLWTTKDYTERDSLEQSDRAPGLAIAPDSKSLAVGRLDGTFALYDTKTGAPLRPARPELTAVEPRGVMRGVTTQIKLTGKNLLGARRLNFAGASPQSFSVRLMPAVAAQPNRLLAEITPAATLARGSYSFTVTTEGGTSTALNLYVDDLPQVAAAEPSRAASQASPVRLPFTAWGTIAARGSRDHYRFDAKAGQTLVFELSAKRAGSTLNGLLTLLDPAGEVVASNNDFDNQSDPLIAYKIPTAGRYTLRVQDFTLTGMATHFYRLSAGELPYVTGVFPLSVPVGRETRLELAGYNLPADARVSVHPQQPGDTMVTLDTNRFRSSQALKVVATADNELVEKEPNDQPAQATPLSTPASVGGRLWSRRAVGPDADLYRFTSRKGQVWAIDTDAARHGSPADTKIEVLDAQGRPVQRLVLQAVRDSYVTFRAVSSRQSDVRVFNWREMELNQLMYMQGEVCKIFRMPQGPDSGFAFYVSGGMRRGYFDTTATAHAMDEPCYIVEPHPPGEKLIPNGLPTFPLYYANDDDAQRELGSDSRLLFTAPADGNYLVRVTDVRGFGGDRFAYRLTVRPAQPGFKISQNSRAPTVNVASGVGLVFRVNRLDGFDDDITIDVTGVPPGYGIASPVVIQAGHLDARTVLNAKAGAVQLKPEDWQKVRFTAHAKVGGETVTQELPGFTTVKLAKKPVVIVKLEPAELTIAPGQTISATLKVDRDGFKDRVPFNVLNLPHGVIVDNIGLNGILVRENETERQIFLTAANWVPETDRYVYAENSNARGASNAGQASTPILLHVRQPGKMASAK